MTNISQKIPLQIFPTIRQPQIKSKKYKQTIQQSNRINQILLPYNKNHMHKKINKTQILTKQGQRIQVSKIQQNIDDMHIVIQSKKPIKQHRSQKKYNQTQPDFQNTQYQIYIDQDDDTNIDLTVNMERNYGTPKNMGKKQYQSNNYINSTIGRSKHYKQDYKANIQKDYPQSIQYHIKYNSNNNQTPPISKTSDLQNYHTYSTQTHHTIRIKSNHPHNSNIKRNMNYQMGNQRPQYRDYQTNKLFNKGTTKQRSQKNFAINSSTLNKQGRIIKNHNIRQNQQTYSQINKSQSSRISHQHNKTSFILQNNPDRISNISQHSNMPQIQLVNKQSPQKIRKQSVQKPNNQKFETDKKQEISTEVKVTKLRTPRNNNYNSEQEQNQQSPIVFNYHSTSFNMQQSNLENPIFIDQHGYTEPIMFQHSTQKIISSGSIKEDRQRQPPTPYNKKLSVQSQLSNPWPPSIKDIPVSPKKIKINLNTSQNKSNGSNNRQLIIVPIQKLPTKNNYQYRTQADIKFATKQTKRIKISLKSPNSRLDINKQRERTNSVKNNDTFQSQKHKYLNKLKEQGKQKQIRQRRQNLKQQNRTNSRSSRYSLSPQCQRITNRLHQSRINRQPCSKFVHYQHKMKRNEMRQTLGEYNIVRRYLSDDQIWDFLQVFERQGIPQKKWPMKLVDIVYDKLKNIKIY